MRSIYLLPLVLLACGDGDKKDPLPDARRADAAIDAPMVVCNYTEAADATNDDFFGNGTAETTGYSLGATHTICGKLDNTHYVANNMLVDVDSYRFTVPAQSSGIVYLTAPGAEALNGVLLEVYSMTNPTSETGKFVGTFAMASVDLAPGEYGITVSSFHGGAPAAAIDYKLVINTDNPQVRCPKSTATPAFTEANDGVLASGNDVYEIRYGGGQPPRKLTAIADAPEPTGIVAAPGMSYRVTGTNVVPNAAPISWMDSFMDRDTYALTMATTADQLSVRVNWPGSTADFDLFVFEVDGLGQPGLIELTQGWYMSNTEDEFVTLAVKPGGTYWVFVGAVDSSTGHPITYDVTFCSATFVP